MPLDLPPLFQSVPAARVQYVESRHVFFSNNNLAKQPEKKYSLPPTMSETPAQKEKYVSAIPCGSLFAGLPVVAMRLPSGKWRYVNPGIGQNGVALSLYLQNQESSEILFSGGEAPTEGQSPLKDFLKRPPAVLSGDELKQICADGSIANAHSEDLNGKRVLVCEGHSASDNRDFYLLRFNYNPDKSSIFSEASIQYTAKPVDYKRNIAAFKKSLKTIKWSDTELADPRFK